MDDKLIIITTPGGAKRDFVNVLHERTKRKVALVIIQIPRVETLGARIRKFVDKVGVRGLPRELFFFFLLKFQRARQGAFNLLKSRTSLQGVSSEYLPPVMYTTNVNGDDVYERVEGIAPRVIAIWGGFIIKPRLIEAAGTVVNIHTGYCPYYRGTNCNLNAMLQDDFEHIGVTLHDAVASVDAGPVRSLITTPCRNRAPSDFMKELNDRAFGEYVDLVVALMQGEIVPAVPQDTTQGKNYRLKEWTYEKQYRVAGILLELEKKYGATYNTP